MASTCPHITRLALTYPQHLTGGSEDLIRAHAAGWHTFRTTAAKTIPNTAVSQPEDLAALLHHHGQWLLTGGVHAAVGVPLVRHTDEPMQTGDTVTVTIGPPGLKIHAPCRVLTAQIGPSCATFVYGTLPGHPEAGEERFHLQWINAPTKSSQGYLQATVSAFSKPASWYTKIGGPVARTAQRYFAHRYAHAMVEPKIRD